MDSRGTPVALVQEEESESRLMVYVEYDSIGKEQLLNQTNSIKLFIPRTIRFRLANSVVMRIKPEKMSLCLYKFSLICYVCCYERRINIFILEARAHVLLTKKTIQFFDLI